MLEAVLKSSSVMIINLILILRVGVLSAHLPEERMELILVAVLLEIIQKLNLLAVRLEVGPHIPVNRNDYLALQILSHAQHVDRCHLILHADRILAKGAERHVNIIVLSMLCEVNGEMRIAGVIRLLIHPAALPWRVLGKFLRRMSIQEIGEKEGK